MAFIDSTSDQRVELLRQAEKAANLTRRVTVGSGTLGAPEGIAGGGLCVALSAALSAIGYGELPPGGAMVDGGNPAPVLKLGGVVLATGTTLVEDGIFEGIELAQEETTLKHADSITVKTSAGVSVKQVQADVTRNTLNHVTLPSDTTVVTNGQSLVVPVSGVYNSEVILAITDGVITEVVLN